MYPNRNNNLPPNANPPCHPKDMVIDLCERIKSEYSGMYTQIQNLKSELDRNNVQKANLDQLYKINQDMHFCFSNEIHKMMDMIKQLVSACQTQMHYVPFELQANITRLLDHVNGYITSEPTLPLFHHLSISNTQAGNMHQEPIPYRFPPSGPGFLPRIPHPLPPPIDGRDLRDFPPHHIDPYRYPIKDVSAPNTDSGASMYKDKNIPRHNGSNDASVTPPSTKTNPSDNNDSGDSPKMIQDSDDKDTKDQENEENQPNDSKMSKDCSETQNSTIGSKRGQSQETQRTQTSPKRINYEFSSNSITRIPRPDSHGSQKMYYNPVPKNGSYGSPYYHCAYPESPMHMTPPSQFIRHPLPSVPSFEGRSIHIPNPHNHIPSHPQYMPLQTDYSDVDINQKTRVPTSLTSFGHLQHGDVVCAASFSRPYNYVFTGSKGVVKIWDVCDVSKPKHLSSIDCLKDNYVRACKSINQNKTLIVCGEYSSIGIWSLNQTSSGLAVNTVAELSNPAPVCYNMAITPDERHIYCCCNNGTITQWDLETTKIIRSFTGHVDGATSIDIPRDGGCVWTGGLDATARCWDMRDGKQIHSFSFPTQVFSLCASQCGSYIVVGLENKTIELCYCKDTGNRFGERNVFKVHDSCVLTVKISNSGRWLISSSKDNYTNCVQIPLGKPLFVTPENASILCADISPDDKYIITGAGDKKATIYECMY